MTFDARSRERLHQLGRTLPQRLPAPESPTPASPAARAIESAEVSSRAQQAKSAHRHHLETETDPEALFHALVQASADGTAPAHLLERLRELEAQRALQDARAADTSSHGAHVEPRSGPRSGPGRQDRERARLVKKLVRDHDDLYIAFQQLLLEDEGT